MDRLNGATAITIIHGNRDQEALFARLLQVTDRQLPGEYNCALQGSGQHMLVMLSGAKSGEEVWHYAGSPQTILKEFQRWLGSQKPN